LSSGHIEATKDCLKARRQAPGSQAVRWLRI
jgi:hypothetical protein